MSPMIPARQILNAAEATNEALGHENQGFLSESHGFMPKALPLLALPASHRAWDEMAAQLPEMFRSLTLRPALEQMPVLSAAEAGLPDRYLLRASAIFSIFAHAYYYVEPNPPACTPLSILQPWEEISRRLDRPAPHLSFIDLNVYNWRLLDPTCPDPMRMENLALLIPIVGNEDERRFQTTPIEMLARSAPAVGIVVRAQEAVVRDDPAALKRELKLLIDNLNLLTYDSFMKVNPNAYSDLYVNPVVWGKTVAPLATPYQAIDPPPGPSGTAIPAFQLLDGFFGRQTYGTSIGHETARTRPWFPKHWREFLDAAEQISVPDYVAQSGDTTLKGIFQEAIDAYAGDTGLLGRHRLKTYGFLDLSFKAGRSKTLGGFGGGFDDRLWDKMDGELNLARLERYTRYPQSCHHVRVKRVEQLSGESAAPVSRVTLDIGETGIRYQPGDRLAILPENSEALVEATLRALHARGEEPIQLNASWREAIKLRDGYRQARVLSLRTLLKFGHIRPVTRPVAKTLYALTHHETLRRIIEARAEDQWELWELLELLAQAGFNPKRFWKAYPGERESICWIVPPESFRMYSISSAMADPAADSAGEIDLTIGHLRYQTKATEVSAAGMRLGTGSNFLAGQVEPAPTAGRLSVKLVHPPRFSLPKEAARPVVMFAGGTGLAPFLSLIQERARQPGAGETWLFFGTRNLAEFYYQEELGQWVAQGKLHLRVACSREEAHLRSENGQLVVEPGRRRHIGDEMLQEENMARLWQFLQSEAEGGLGAYFYVCGRTGFAKAVLEGVKAILERFAEGPEAVRQETARRMLYRLTGEDRYMQEIFTTYTGPQFEQPRIYDASEVVCHNNERDGYWMIINGRVYDLTEFAHLHPGGLKIIASYAGMDATTAYQKVLHDVNPEVDAMLGLVEIGVVRRLDFGQAGSVVISRQGLQFVSLKDIYRAWIGALYMIVEMENALHNDYGVRQEPVTYNETPTTPSPSPYKIQLYLQTHQRFMHEYLAKLTGELAEQLWTLSSGLHSRHLDVRWLAQQLTNIQQSAEAQAVAGLPETIMSRLKTLAQPGAAPDPQRLTWAEDCCKILEAEDKRLMREAKLALRAGVQVFEQFEHETIAKGSKQLLAAVKQLPDILEDYYKQVGSSLPAT